MEELIAKIKELLESGIAAEEILKTVESVLKPAEEPVDEEKEKAEFLEKFGL